MAPNRSCAITVRSAYTLHAEDDDYGQANTQFASLAIPEVEEVGEDLDRKLASLLEALDVPVPAPLVGAPAANTHAFQDPACEHGRETPW